MPSAASQFNNDATRMVRDLGHRQMVQQSLSGYQKTRSSNAKRFQDWASARSRAAATKDEAIRHLDRYLEQFEEKLVVRGAKVFWANDATEARTYILDLARAKQARAIVKSKTMVSEEIHLNDALEKAGFQVVESDLGEFIVQLRHETPYHIVFPSMHLTRGQIRELFAKELGSTSTDNPEELTMVARRVMRSKYITADVGFTGGNFAIAETGMISITENEGNARLTAALPKTMVTLIGIEKVLPRLADLALFLPMLATAGTGQQITCYNTMYGGPRQPGGVDGPEAWPVILLDHHPTELL